MKATIDMGGVPVPVEIPETEVNSLASNLANKLAEEQIQERILQFVRDTIGDLVYQFGKNRKLDELEDEESDDLIDWLIGKANNEYSDEDGEGPSSAQIMHTLILEAVEGTLFDEIDTKYREILEDRVKIWEVEVTYEGTLKVYVRAKSDDEAYDYACDNIDFSELVDTDEIDFSVEAAYESEYTSEDDLMYNEPFYDTTR